MFGGIYFLVINVKSSLVQPRKWMGWWLMNTVIRVTWKISLHSSWMIFIYINMHIDIDIIVWIAVSWDVDACTPSEPRSFRRRNAISAPRRRRTNCTPADARTADGKSWHGKTRTEETCSSEKLDLIGFHQPRQWSIGYIAVWLFQMHDATHFDQWRGTVLLWL